MDSESNTPGYIGTVRLATRMAYEEDGLVMAMWVLVLSPFLYVLVDSIATMDEEIEKTARAVRARGLIRMNQNQENVEDAKAALRAGAKSQMNLLDVGYLKGKMEEIAGTRDLAEANRRMDAVWEWRDEQ
jgi:hypothetical protein